MEEIFLTDKPWVIFNLMNQVFAASANNVREMVTMPEVTLVPQTPQFIRGIMNLRGRVIPVLDLRLKLGMISKLEENDLLIETLKQREQDHIKWIEELELSINEKREFTLATNPHKCAFGKWYDNFETETQLVAFWLGKFDEPHKNIHKIAHKVKAHEKQNNFKEAYGLINKTRECELSEMIKLFSETRHILTESNQEIALVFNVNQCLMAVAVDSVETVEKIENKTTEKLDNVMNYNVSNCISGLAIREKGDQIVLILELNNLCSEEVGLFINRMNG